MPIFRVTASTYFGDDAILVSADSDGLGLFASALRSARDNGDSTFDSDGIRYRVVRQDGAADLELGLSTVIWRLDSEKISEIIDLTEPLMVSNITGHQYVDINSPTSTLIISVGESG